MAVNVPQPPVSTPFPSMTPSETEEFTRAVTAARSLRPVTAAQLTAGLSDPVRLADLERRFARACGAAGVPL